MSVQLYFLVALLFTQFTYPVVSPVSRLALSVSKSVNHSGDSPSIMGDDEEVEKQQKSAYKSLIGRLGGHKAYLTRLVGNVAEFVDKIPLEEDELVEANLLSATISDRSVIIEELFDELLGNPQIQNEDIDNFEVFMKGIKSKLAKLKHKINKSTIVPKKEELPSPSVPKSGTLDSAVKYPEIKLPTFSGGVHGSRDFRPFYQIFKALVEDKKDVPDIYKVQYLRGCLPEHSEAYQLISHIPPTAENYAIHMETLQGRYSNVIGEVNQLRRSLMEVGNWSVCNSIESQRKLVDHVRQKLALLAQLETVEEEDLKCLSMHLMGVLPERLKYKAVKLRKEERTVEAIMNLVETAIESKLEVKSYGDPSKKPEKRNSQPPPKQYTHLYHSAEQVSQNSDTARSHLYHSSEQVSSGTSPRQCVYCGGGGHTPHQCTAKPQEERAAIIAQGRRCWNCLSDEHQVKACRVPSRCDCGKKGKHSKSLCGITPPWRGTGRTKSKGKVVHSSMITSGRAGEPYLSTVELEMTDKWGQPVKVRFLLDNAATHTYGVESVISKLPVTEKNGVVDMTVSTFSGLRKITTRMVDLALSDQVSISLVVTDHICEPLHGQPLDEQSVGEMKSYQLADESCVKGGPLPIDILVGVDNYWKIVTDQVVRLKSGVVIMSTLFGWVLSGEVCSRKSLVHGGTLLAHTLLVHDELPSIERYGLFAQDPWYSPAHSLCCKQVPVSDPVDIQDDDLEEVKCDLERFFDLDTLGIRPEREISPVLEEFLHTVSQDPVSKRFTVSLPRKRNITSLPSNFNSSLRRLDSLASKLARPGNEEFASKYRAVIKDQLEQGVIERVVLSDEEREKLVRNPGQPVGHFYIPHHGVQKQRSDKVRVVYDGSAHAYKGALSLNQCLFVGPSLMNHLAEVLMTFRFYLIVLLADIEKAFLQIEVAKEDRDLLRFLWYDEFGNLEVYRFTRVPFGTGPSPFLLNATLQHHLESVVKDEELLWLLLRSLYVDDVLTGGETTEFVLKLKEKLVEIFGEAAMQLHGWNSNSAVVREALGVVDQTDDLVVLGVLWNRVTDQMGLNLEKVMNSVNGPSTKRELLRVTAQFFDPHGLLNPVILIPKLLFQRVCRSKIGWDDPLPDDIEKEWSEWKSQISFLERVRVQRHCLLPNYDRLELHGFSDASEVAYSAVVYVKSSRGNESMSNLIMCKNRVAPLKKLSIPRLELMGALLLSRLMAVVVAFLKHLKIDAILYYTDSMNVLYWIRTEHRMWCIFVACRIKEINSLSSFVSWKYVRTHENPADVATRGLKPAEFVNHELYMKGPGFLHTGRSDPDVDYSHPPSACLKEKKKAVHVVAPVKREILVFGIKCENFSSLPRLFHRTANVLKFAYLFAQKYSKNPGHRFDISLPALFGHARQLWVKAAQAAYYPEELKFCQNNPAKRPRCMKVPTSLCKQYDLYIDSVGMLRIRTALTFAIVEDSVKYPILMPGDSHYAKLMIRDAHLRLCHGGVRQVMESVRGYYWIPKCRRVVSKVVKSCFNCLRVTGETYPVADPPPLPEFRVGKVDAFDHVGLDHCGPLYVREGKKKGQKCYVLIITCAVSRAVHLELVWDLSVHHFMLGFRRFVATRGLPSYILSDNSKTFDCASSEFNAILNDDRFQRYLAGRNIRWQQYPDYSPWWGGFIERLNRSFKASIRKVLWGTSVEFIELYTLLKEVEAIMNSRPISYVYDDVNEGQAITPSLLLCGKDLTQLPPDMFIYKFERKNPQTCRERLKYLEKIRKYFETRWKKDYLLELEERRKHLRRGKEVREARVDDIVLVKEGGDLVKLPRTRWRLGRVAAVHPGRDGRVRSVDVDVVSPGGTEPCVLRHRSPRHLVPLECDELED